jgi:hypothetical protein
MAKVHKLNVGIKKRAIAEFPSAVRRLAEGAECEYAS